MIFEKTTLYYFAIPLENIEGDRQSKVKFAFCSIFVPVEREEDDCFLVKVFNFFSETTNVLIHDIENSDLLFGESLILPFIPLRGKSKWTLLEKKIIDRTYSDFPDLKLSNLEFHKPMEERRWFRIFNCGFGTRTLERQDYSLLKHLEFGDDLSEIGVKMRIYIHLMNQDLSESTASISKKAYCESLFQILRNEPSLIKMSDQTIKEQLIANYIDDYFYSDVANRKPLKLQE